MLADPEEVQEFMESMRSVQTVPYIDPNLKTGLLSLAGRMAAGGMLWGTPEEKATVGCFTVVTSVVTGGQGVQSLTLRLVFDERVPNDF